MAITLVQSKTGTSSTAVTTASFNTTPTNGNLIVLAFSADDYNGTPDTGWTQSTGMEQQTNHGGYVWWKIASGGSNSFQYTIGSATGSAWLLMEFSGVAASPYDISAGTLNGSSAQTMSTPSITPTAGNRLLVAAIGANSAVENMSGGVGTFSNSFTKIGSVGLATSPGNQISTAYLLVSPASGSTSYSTTLSDFAGASPQTQSGLIIAFKEAAGGAYSLTAAQGSYTLTGQAAGLNKGSSLVAAQGSYSLTGQAATLSYSGGGGGPAISLVQSAEGTSTSATTTASFSVTPTAGNLIVLAFTGDDVQTAVGSGWNQSTNNAFVNETQSSLWWRIATSGNSFQYTINSATASSWVLMEFAGIDANPYDISDGQATGTNNLQSSYNTPALTPTAGDRLIVASIHGNANNNTDYSGDLTGWTGSFNHVRTSAPAGTTGLREIVGTAYRIISGGNGATAYSTGATFTDLTRSQTGLIISFKRGATTGGSNTLTAAQGTYTLSGQAVNLTEQRTVIADQGTYTLTGQDAGLSKGNTLPADFGVYSLTGIDATLVYSGNTATHGITLIEKVRYRRYRPFRNQLTQSVTAANPPPGNGVVADQGVYTLTGFDANLTIAGRILTADTGLYSLTGIDANLFKTGIATLSAATGLYTLTGFPADLRSSQDFSASGGSGPRRNLVASQYDDNPIWEPQPFDFEEEEELLRLILSM